MSKRLSFILTILLLINDKQLVLLITMEEKYRMGKRSNSSTKYQKKHPILEIIAKTLLNIVISALLLGFGFWLAFASTMGPAYQPEVMNGALDMWIRFTMLGIGAIIWLVTPIWFVWSSVRYSHNSYKSYQSYKRFK